MFRRSLLLLLAGTGLFASAGFAEEFPPCPAPVFHLAPVVAPQPTIRICPTPIVTQPSVIVREVPPPCPPPVVVVPARPAYTPQGVTAFAALFQAAAEKGVENAMVRGFNATKVQTDDCKTGPCAETKPKSPAPKKKK